MAGLSLDTLPAVARTAWLSLRDKLVGIVEADLVAVWAYGSTIVADGQRVGDLDTHIILASTPDEATARAVEEAQDAIERELGVEWDAWYVLADDARRSDPPRHALRADRRDTSWALHRAHWLAGQFVNLHGSDPVDLVVAPTWPELESELSREMEHIERHVWEGDTDPYEATYAMLNGSRVLYSQRTRDVVISKRAAGTWALDHLPDRWEAALAAALRTYDRRGDADDAALLASEMAAFVAFCRDQLPVARRQVGDAVPRWSGY